MKIYLGNPMVCTIKCKHLVAGVLTLFDPTVVKCSWLNPSGAEDMLLYGGSEIGDSLFTKLSTGIYQAIYTSNLIGEWTVGAYWSHTSGGTTLTFRDLALEKFDVRAIPFGFSDTVMP